jgi:hypothetical protein
MVRRFSGIKPEPAITPPSDTRKEAGNALSDFRRQINQGNFITAKQVPQSHQDAQVWFGAKREHRPSAQ